MTIQDGRPKIASPSLNQRFWIAIAVVMACSLALGLGLIASYYQRLESSRNNLAKLEVFRVALDVANSISAERGRANRVLGVEINASDDSRQLLQKYRAQTDASLALAAEIPTLASRVPKVTLTLNNGRKEIDELAQMPLTERATGNIVRAEDAMFRAYDDANSLVALGMSDLVNAKNNLGDRVLVMRMLGELRDCAARLGSYLVVPMIRGEKMDSDRSAAFNLTRGRVWELWHLVAPLTENETDPDLARAHTAVVSHYLGDGRALLQKTLSESFAGNYSVNPSELTAQVTEIVTPLEQLRDAFAENTISELKADAAKALRLLIIVAGTTGLALSIELFLLISSQKVLFRPLLLARDRVVDFASDKLDEPPSSFQPQGEIHELYEALASLRLKLIERLSLIEGLRRQAGTDGLTGVLNRHSFEQLEERLFKGKGRKRSIGLIMIDIDHFKSVNDNYGHQAGDDVLREAARRLQAGLRDIDLIARYGGEEFVIVLGDEGDGAAEVAERLRHALQFPPFEISDQPLQVTASFGVVVAKVCSDEWSQIVAAADQALYEAKENGRNRVVSRQL